LLAVLYTAGFVHPLDAYRQLSERARVCLRDHPICLLGLMQQQTAEQKGSTGYS
jgi:hypothetical protein